MKLQAILICTFYKEGNNKILYNNNSGRSAINSVFAVCTVADIMGKKMGHMRDRRIKKKINLGKNALEEKLPS